MILMKILFAAGGTGGHLFPALAVARALQARRPSTEVLFAGTRSGLEATVVPKAGFQMAPISIHGLRRALVLSNFLLPLLLLKSIGQSFSIIRRFAPDIVFGTGGYVAGPVLTAALLSGIPTMLHEQNSRPGLTTRWLSKWVSSVLLSFAQSEVYFRRKDNLRFTGNPTRMIPKTGDSNSARLHFGLKEDPYTVLIFGGSAGAHSLNMAVLDALRELMSKGPVQVLWQTGKRDFEGIKDRALPFGNRVQVLPFIEDMADAYQAADVVLCRAGATTLAEITDLGCPAILVPYPHATGRHQEINARVLVEAGAAEMILDQDLSGPKVAAMIFGLLRDTARRKMMRETCKSMGCPKAADDIVEAIEELVPDRSDGHDS